MRAVTLAELDEEIGIELNAAFGVGFAHDRRARGALRVELAVPRAVERIGEVDPSAVATDFHHLRAPGKRPTVWMGGVARNPADSDGTHEFRAHGVRDVVLPQLAGSPAGNVKKA